jgi:hypothetical protein
MGPPADAGDATGGEDAMAELAQILGPTSTAAPAAPAPAAPAAPAPAAPTVAAAPAATTLAHHHEPDAAELVVPLRAAAAPAPGPAPAGSMPTVPLRGLTRAARFGAPVTDPLAAPPAPAAPPASTASGTQASGAAGRPWGSFVDPNRAPDVVSARQAMSAAKVVAPLVAAVSFKPGKNGSPKEMAQSLTTMMVAVHRSSTRIAERWSQQYGKDVPAWTVSQLMQSMAEVVAQRWERAGTADVEQLTELMCGLLTDQDGDVTRMLIEAADYAYVEASSPDVAANRLAVSTAGAGWTLYDWVTRDQLSTGDGYTYSYDLEPSEVVSRMLRHCVSFCRSMPLNVSNADMRVAHMQASVRRMANLMGAEYVASTRTVMNWIGQEDISDEEFAARKHAAAKQFETHILPHVFEFASRNFLRVERGAFTAIEDLNEKQNTDGGSGAADRPLQQ